MSENYRIVGYKDFLGSGGELDGRNDVFIGSYYNSLEEAEKDAERFLRSRKYFHVKIMKEVASWRLEEVEPAKLKIDRWL